MGRSKRLEAQGSHYASGSRTVTPHHCWVEKVGLVPQESSIDTALADRARSPCYFRHVSVNDRLDIVRLQEWHLDKDTQKVYLTSKDYVQ